MTGFDFKKWCSENGLKQSTVESLEKNDLDSEEALKLVNKQKINDVKGHFLQHCYVGMSPWNLKSDD